MTNQPLTAEDFDDIEELTPESLDYFLREIWSKKTVSVIHFYGLGGERYTRHPVMDLFKAYAAQQNAELVAELEIRKGLVTLNRTLLTEVERLKAELKDAEINFNALADGTIQNEAFGMLKAENERLKQQLAWQPIPENPENYQVILGWDGKETEKYMYHSEFYKMDLLLLEMIKELLE